MHGISPPRLGANALALALLLGSGVAVQAEPLRCNGTSVSEGDSKLWLIRACGQPAISDSYCARLAPAVPVHGGTPVYPPVCVVTEEWLYERGPGNLVAVVRIREGRIVSIRFGEQGRSESR